MKNITFKNLDITINSGELIGIIGPNASGKTCLLRMISGRVQNDYINIDAKNINNYSLEYKRNNIVCVFDDNIYNTHCVRSELRYYLEKLFLREEKINAKKENNNGSYEIVAEEHIRQAKNEWFFIVLCKQFFIA